MTEPITLHDAIMALAADITNDAHLPNETKLRWLEMVQEVNRAHSRELLASLDTLSVALQDAIDALHFTHDEDAPAPTSADDPPDELGDDFGDDALDD